MELSASIPVWATSPFRPKFTDKWANLRRHNQVFAMMSRARARILKWTAFSLVVAGGIVYLALRKSAADAPVTFRTGKVDRGTVEQIVTATGQLNAVVTVQVGSQVSGIIQKLNADFNSHVTEGQIIAQIDPTRFKATLDQTQAALKNAEASLARARVNHDLNKREWERGRELVEKAVIGQSEIDTLKSKYDLGKVEVASAEAQVSQARASVGAARVDLERTTIRAPISGTVLQRAVDKGQTVAASLQSPTLFTIAQDLSKMEVRAAIDEADVGKLREGLEARFTVDAYTGQEFVATIFQIRSNPNVQQNVVTYDAILRVDNPDGKLRPGMTANVRIVSQRRENVLRVPNAALRFKPPTEMVATTTGGEGQGPRAGDGGAPREGRGPGGREAWAARRAEGGMGRGEGGMGRGEGRGGAGPGGGGFRRGGGGEGGGRSFARVYRPQGEKVVTIPFRPGIADDEYTEVLGGRVSLGDEVILDASGGAFQSQAQQQQRPSGNMMRGRGPRMF
jgi:HlyD family secretion protein